ncbi:MAG TPA: hypothetical protein VE915_01280 [Actinomycetota bacterium]|nr:hypothetical protein [Actinomycetota bacterium]
MGVRVPVVLLVYLSLAGCGAPADPSEPPGSVDPARVATMGVENAAIRQVVVDFLDAYAESGSDTEPLGQLVAGPHLEDWVCWLSVRNVGLEGLLAGELDLRDLRVLEIGEQVAAAAVDATVTVTVPGEGGVDRIPRNFGSPVLLARAAEDPTSWQVVDATRDGRSMQDSITLFDEVPARADEDGIRIEVVSLYRFTSGTVANMRIRNGTNRTLRVDIPHSILQVGGRFHGAMQGTPTLRLSISPGDSVDGALNFPPVTLMSNPELVKVHFRGDPAPVATVTLPAEAFLPGSSA